MAEHLADRTNRGRDHRHPDDEPLPGLEPAPEPTVDLDTLEACR